jgi:hypothetical protein
MVTPHGYQVDPEAVDGVVRTMCSQIDEFGKLCRQFGQLVPPVAAFGGVASPAGIAAKTAHEMLQRAQEALEALLNVYTRNVQTAMTNYRTNSGGGAVAISQSGDALAASDGLIRRLRSSGLGAGGIHSYLRDQAHQVDAGIAELYVGRDPSEVRLRPGDLVTTADLTATVGADGRLYANGVPVPPPSGQEARVYRSMMVRGGS